MRLAFEHRQAIEMRPQASLEHGIAVIEQVMGGEGARHAGARALDKGHAFRSRDMLQYHPESRQAFDERRKHAVDEDLFAIEDIDLGIGRFAMHQQR